MNRSQRGFSLLEVLVAVSVVLILIAAVAPSLVASIQAGHESTAAQNLKQFAKAEADYQTLYNTFAPSPAALGGVTDATHCPALPDTNGTWSCLLPNATAQAMTNGTAVTSYIYTYTAPTVPGGAWAMQAVPSGAVSGRKSYCADSSGAVYSLVGTTAPPLVAGANSCDPTAANVTLVGLSF